MIRTLRRLQLVAPLRILKEYDALPLKKSIRNVEPLPPSSEAGKEVGLILGLPIRVIVAGYQTEESRDPKGKLCFIGTEEMFWSEGTEKGTPL